MIAGLRETTRSTRVDSGTAAAPSRGALDGPAAIRYAGRRRRDGITVPGRVTATTGASAKRERTMQEMSRILTAAGLVIASVGLTVYGMAASYYNPGTYDLELGRWMMVIGTVVSIVGVVLYRKTWAEAQDDWPGSPTTRCAASPATVTVAGRCVVYVSVVRTRASDEASAVDAVAARAWKVASSSRVTSRGRRQANTIAARTRALT